MWMLPRGRGDGGSSVVGVPINCIHEAGGMSMEEKQQALYLLR